uniref:Uncharacterized protein n=1 Tax=Mycena chlorophos TaxID=658473 RepID=A0ABQ0L6C8_MYCCL|nr:predicted protein [Mycena chlorophos]
MSSESENDDFIHNIPSQTASSFAPSMDTSSAKRLTKKRRKAMENGTHIGPDRKSGETDFRGARKEVMDQHFSKYPRGVRHPTSHWRELFDAFDARVSFRLSWDEEPPSDPGELAQLNQPVELHEEDLKAERTATNYKKLRNFYNGAGSSTGGAKSTFKSVIKKLAAGDGPVPHRPAVHFHYAKQPEFRAKIMSKFAQKYPQPELLGGQRLNTFNRMAKKMFAKEPEDVRDRVLTDLNESHSRALTAYKAALTGSVLEGITPEQQVAIRGRFSEVVAPFLDDLQKASGYEIAMHAGRIDVGEKGKPELDFCSVFSGIGGENIPEYKILKQADPKTSAVMARGWGKHVFNIYQAENGLERGAPEDVDAVAGLTTSAGPSNPVTSTLAPSTRSESTPTPSIPSHVNRKAGASQARRRRATVPADEQGNSDVEITPADKRRAILGAVELYKKKLWDDYEKANHAFQNPPPECRNPVLLDLQGQEELGMALRGMDLYRLFEEARYPRHEPIIDVECFDETPAICLSEYHNPIGPLTRAWICNPDLEVSERSRFVTRTHKMDPTKLAQEELESSSCWARVRRAANKQRLLDVPSWGGVDAAEGLKKRKRDGERTSDEDYETEEDGGRKKGKRRAKKHKSATKKSAKAPMLSQVVDKPRPKPKKLPPKAVAQVEKAPKQTVAQVEEPEVEEPEVEEPQVEEPQVEDQHLMDPEDIQDVTMDEQDSLEAWVRNNPNLMDEDAASALLQAEFEAGKYEMDVDDNEQSMRDELGVGGQESERESECESEREAERESEPEPVNANRGRAAKTRAVTGLADLYEKYLTPAASRKTGSATAKKTLSRVAKSHAELVAHSGVEMAFKAVAKYPEWATEAKQWLLGLVGGGDDWERVVERWYKYEGQFQFQEPDGVRPSFIFSTEQRPDVVGAWISVARPLKVMPAIKKLTKEADVEKFGKSVRRWWYSINPSWRLQRQGPRVRIIRTGEHKDWYSVLWPGPNGFLAVLACLFWWGGQVQGDPQADEKWMATVQDFGWVIDNITRNVVEKGEMSEGDVQGEGDTQGGKGKGGKGKREKGKGGKGGSAHRE